MKLIKSSLLVKLVILILVVYATVTLVNLQSRISDKKAEADSLTASITTTEQEIHHIFRLSDRAKREYRCIYCDAKAQD